MQKRSRYNDLMFVNYHWGYSDSKPQSIPIPDTANMGFIYRSLVDGRNQPSKFALGLMHAHVCKQTGHDHKAENWKAWFSPPPIFLFLSPSAQLYTPY